jgi:hypothetical protein
MAPRITDFRDHVTVTINSYSSTVLLDNELPKLPAISGSVLTYGTSHTAVLGCAAQSHPPPRFSWYRKMSDGQLQLLTTSTFQSQHSDSDLESQLSSSASSPSASVVTSASSSAPASMMSKYVQVGGVLYVNRLHLLDSGLYVCLVNSSLAEERAETVLQINGKFAFINSNEP